jgi:hypothetical protein
VDIKLHFTRDHNNKRPGLTLDNPQNSFGTWLAKPFTFYDEHGRIANYAKLEFFDDIQKMSESLERPRGHQAAGL